MRVRVLLVACGGAVDGDDKEQEGERGINKREWKHVA